MATINGAVQIIFQMVSFSPEIWSIIVLITVAFCVLYSCICRLAEGNGGRTSFARCASHCMKASLGISIVRMPQSNTSRFFLLIWILYCYILNLIYQSQLIVMLTQPTSEHQITTPEEIISTNIHFGFPKNFEVHLERMNTSAGKYFVDKNVVCNFNTCLKEMSNRPFATMGNRMYLQYAIAFENQHVKFYTITKPVAKSFVQMIMAKGFPLRDKINFKIRRMVEIGYLAASQTYYQKLVANVSIYDRRAAVKVDSLQMNHFAGAFFVLSFGLLGALIAFALEMLSTTLKTWTIIE